MIYYLTVHWKSAQWIRIQNAFIRKNTGPDLKIFAFLNGFDPQDWLGYFDYVSTEDIVAHAVKLNLLADLAAMHSGSDDDILIFVDGDAFPVEPVDALCAKVASGTPPLIAVQRLENAGDPQPHPSFCITTVGFWRKIGGDWKEGPTWKNRNGEEVTDVGARLLRLLEDQGIAWEPLLRTNKTDLHPLWFGVYGDVAYHHGAGFRPQISRLDFVWLRRLASLLPPKLRKRLSDRFLPALLQKRRKQSTANDEISMREIEENFRFHERLTTEA